MNGSSDRPERLLLPWVSSQPQNPAWAPLCRALCVPPSPSSWLSPSPPSCASSSGPKAFHSRVFLTQHSAQRGSNCSICSIPFWFSLLVFNCNNKLPQAAIFIPYERSSRGWGRAWGPRWSWRGHRSPLLCAPPAPTPGLFLCLLLHNQVRLCPAFHFCLDVKKQNPP